MQSRFVAVLVMVCTLVAAIPAEALQCVPFAREHSGISLRGDAWTWWSAAAGQYDRGSAPRVGAVVVFKKYGAMRHGHVAVVTQVVGSRQVLVDHANWGSRRVGGRGAVAKNMAVVDVSARNDWTEVRVWNLGTNDYGTRVYPTYGFIYAGDDADDTVSAKDMMHLRPSELLTDASFAYVASPRVEVKPLEPVKSEVKAIAAPAKAEPKVEAKVEPKVEAKVEPKIELKQVAKLEQPDVKPAAATGFSAEDLALAKSFGSGHY